MCDVNRRGKERTLTGGAKRGASKVRTRWKGDLGTADEGSTRAETDRWQLSS